MRFGFTVPHYGFSLPGGAPITFEAAAAWARRAEDAGFDSVAVSDHFFYSFGRYGADPAPIDSLEPLTALAGLATATERVRLQTLVLCGPFRHPAVLAKMAATIDLLSEGRLDLGLGAGWLEDEFAAFGYRFGTVGERFDALEETLEALGALFASDGDPVTYEGPTVTLREARLLPSPAQRPIPLWVGGKGGPRLLRLAARHAAGWNVVWRVAPDRYAATSDGIASACEEAGRDPATFRRTIGLYTLVGEDEADARGAFGRGRAAMPGGALDGDTYDSWRADTLSGTPEQVRARIDEFERIGVEEIVVAPWVLPFAVPEPDRFDAFVDGVLGPILAERR